MPIPRRNLIFIVSIIVLIFLFIGASIYIVNFPDNHPDKTLEIGDKVSNFFDALTLPIKIAKLSTQSPDEKILIPVYGLRRSGISDTWAATRGVEGEMTHEGQDMFAPKGTPIFSGTYGYISRIDEGDLGGKYVYIVGAGGRRYYYAHLDRYPAGLHAGQEVTVDTVIGFVGNTGNAVNTPSHLHFGMYQKGEPINPLPLLVDGN